MTTGNIYTSN